MMDLKMELIYLVVSDFSISDMYRVTHTTFLLDTCFCSTMEAD